ncbi:hypothetical protein [Natrinema salaciae]|uniref:Uncharacterized protein n=1 Tax=Natrinema salaciae TaxID=1186196 RepID=A0A1H8ZPV4_9EURY|nr:hypothetical protein [Natrinema salaciae]SEP66529.1 hypothetical protein SAMN04489841_0232 [Natrinema salaciae]
MTLDPSGTAGHVSDHISSDHIVDDRPVDLIHVVVYCVPSDDDNLDLNEGDRAHDVVLREPENEEGDRPVVESWVSFPNGEEACVQALDLSESHDAPIWDDIIRLSPESRK